MKKKTYEQPKMKVVEIDQADIICTSTTTDAFGNPTGLGYDEQTW